MLGLLLCCICLPVLAQTTDDTGRHPLSDLPPLDLPPLDLLMLDLPSQISVEWLAGNDGRDDLFIDLDLSIGGPRLLLSLAQSRVDNSFSPYTTRSYLLGLYNDPLQTLNIGAELRHWGLADNLVSLAARGFVAVNGADWSVALRPQLRDIRFSTSAFCRQFPECPDEWRVRSRGIAIDGNYYIGAWGLALGLSAQDYDRDLRPLATRALLLRLFTPLALELASGLEDYGISLGLRYAFSHGLLSVDEYRSVSAVDGLASWLTSARLSLDLDRHWGVALSAALLQMPQLDDVNTTYAGLGLVYRW